MRLALTVAICTLPVMALAVGSDDDTPPQPTDTTKNCTDGQVWDTSTQSCVNPDKSTNADTQMKKDARALAYAGRYDDAAKVLDVLDAGDPWVMTYRGFLARKTGDDLGAYRYYTAALEADPNHLMARSYMGQGFAEAGDLKAARAQLTEIRARGGRGTWPELALRLAIDSGQGTTY